MERLQQQKHALGSTAYITLVATPVVAEPLFAELWRQIDKFEQRFSRFLPSSELSQLNAAAGEWHPVSADFLALLQTVRSWSDRTSGLYNPLILPALQRAGYKGSWPSPQTPNRLTNYEQRSIADWHSLELSGSTARIPANTALDLGGIGKGYLLDQLGAYLAKQNTTNYWLSLGGDVLCSGHDLHEQPWSIGIQNATGEPQPVATATPTDSPYAIATSGITKRQGTHAGSMWHHLIDPRSGKPAQTDVLTATVCAPTATAADIAAKCLVIAGSAAIPDTIQQLDMPHAFVQYDPTQHQPNTYQTGDIWS